MVDAAKKSQELEMSLESFFLGKWVLEDALPRIPVIHHMSRLRSHYKEEFKGNMGTEIQQVSGGKPPSVVVKNVKRTDIVFNFSTPDKQVKSKGRSKKRKTRKSEKVEGNSETANPSPVMGKLPSESPIHCVKKTDVVETANPDGQIKNKGRGVKRKTSKTEITESQAETRIIGLHSLKVRQRRIPRDQNKENITNEHSFPRPERKAAKKAQSCINVVIDSVMKPSPDKDGFVKSVRCKKKEPNKDRQEETDQKVEDKPKEKRKCRRRCREVSGCEQEKNVKVGEKENEPSEGDKVKILGRKAKANRRYVTEDNYDDPREKKKKVAEKELENSSKKQSLMENINKTKKACTQTQNKTISAQKKLQNKNMQEPDDVKSRKKRDRSKTASTVKSKKVKKADEVATKACTQEIQKENLIPEDCVITARKGTLKYLKQRERLLEVKAKEVQVEDDFFSNVAFKWKNLDLLAPDDTFTIKTPESKIAQVTGNVFSPRTALLGQLASMSPASCPLTSSPRSPVLHSKANRNDALRVIYHSMKETKRRPRGIRKKCQDNFALSDNMIKKPMAPKLLELPDFLNATDNDSSHDEYFNNSDMV